MLCVPSQILFNNKQQRTLVIKSTLLSYESNCAINAIPLLTQSLAVRTPSQTSNPTAYNKIRRMTSSRQLSSSCRSFINRTKILNSIATPLFLLFLESSYGSNHISSRLSNTFFGIASIKPPPNCIVSDVCRR